MEPTAALHHDHPGFANAPATPPSPAGHLALACRVPVGVVFAAARATAAGLTGGGDAGQHSGNEVGRRPLLTRCRLPRRPGLCALSPRPPQARGPPGGL